MTIAQILRFVCVGRFVAWAARPWSCGTPQALTLWHRFPTHGLRQQALPCGMGFQPIACCTQQASAVLGQHKQERSVPKRHGAHATWRKITSCVLVFFSSCVLVFFSVMVVLDRRAGA